MDNNLESLLEKYGATDDEQLSRALDEILSDPDSLTAQELEEATDLKLSLMGKNPEDAKDYAARINEKALESVKALEKKKKTLSVFSKRFMPFAAMLILVVLISFAAKLLPMQIPPKPDPSLEAPTSSNNLTDPPPASSESPTSTAAPVTSTAPPTSTAAPVTSTVPSTSTVPPATNNGEEAMGGDWSYYNLNYIYDFVCIPGYFEDFNLMGNSGKTISDWKSQFKSSGGTKDGTFDFTLYNLFKYLDVTREQMEEVLAKIKERQDSLNTEYLFYFDEEELDIFFGDMTEEEIYRHYAQPYTVLVGKYSYPAKYFVENNYEQYKLDGITLEAIDEKFSLLAGACRSSATVIEKLVNNIAEYKESEGVLEYSATPFEGKEHVTAAYLCEIGSEKWADEGITKEMIKEHAFDLLYTCQDKDQMKYLVIEAALRKTRYFSYTSSQK